MRYDRTGERRKLEKGPRTMVHREDRAAMRQLLGRLLVGADRLMESAGDWAELLAGEQSLPVVARFVDQLDAEWFDAMPLGSLCYRVTDLVRARLSAWHEGWPHLWAHVLRVTGLAVALAEEAGLDPVPAYLAGICHDVAKLDELRTSKPHEEVSAAFAGETLRGDLPPGVIAAIQAAIRKRGDGDLMYVLHDADKLDKIGAVGIVRRVSTGANWEWLDEALSRVAEDARRFPSMHFPLSRALARDKRVFVAWFLPRADEAMT